MIPVFFLSRLTTDKELDTRLLMATVCSIFNEALQTLTPTKNLIQLNDHMNIRRNQTDVGEFTEVLHGSLSDLCQHWKQHVRFLVNEFETSCDFFKLLSTVSPDILQVDK